MGTAVRKFVLPRLSVSKNPRVVARTALRMAPRAAPAEPIVDPLENWHPGFSKEAALDHLHDLGASFPQRPHSDPEMPEDVTTLGSEELGTLYAQYVAYVQWLETELALCQIGADESDSHLEHIEAEIRLRKSGTVKDRDNKAKQDEKYIAHEQRALMDRAKAKLLAARVKGYERCANALSREMSRRAPGTMG